MSATGTGSEACGLRVGLIAPPWVAVPPPVYGGTEAVVHELAVGLARRGVEVVLFATEDATCPVERRWLHRRALGTGLDDVAEGRHVEAAYAALHDVDLIHDHTVTGPGMWSLHPDGVPVVTTVHNPFTPELRRRYLAAPEHGVAIITVSDDQRRRAFPVPTAATIHHGIDLAAVPVGPGDGGFVLFLGRMSPDKGAHRAIEAARAAGWPIVLAAKMHEPEELAYFHARVEPNLGPDAVYVGEVGRRQKLDLLGRAAALVNPIRWPEPFGLVMIEALGCGTPVVAFAEGAAPEIVIPGLTGDLCRDVDAMAASLRSVERFDRRACRADVEKRFSADRMVDDHLVLYHQLLATGPSAGRTRRTTTTRAGLPTMRWSSRPNLAPQAASS
jgi:glycosyltransferase involved in cell wall biosynthesis